MKTFLVLLRVHRARVRGDRDAAIGQQPDHRRADRHASAAAARRVSVAASAGDAAADRGDTAADDDLGRSVRP